MSGLRPGKVTSTDSDVSLRSSSWRSIDSRTGANADSSSTRSAWASRPAVGRSSFGREPSDRSIVVISPLGPSQRRSQAWSRSISATVVSASVAFPRTSSIREDKPCDAVVMEPSSFDPQRPVRHKKTPRPCRGVFLCLTGRCGSNEEGSMTTASHGLSSRIDEVRGKATEALTTVADIERLHAWERRWLGPKGEITTMLRSLGSLPKEDRPTAGRDAQALRVELESAFAPVRESIERQELDRRLTSESVDVTLPGRKPDIGAMHPVSAMIDELIEVFALLGFQAVFGPEVETGRYNFDLLNIPADHPARDVWDTIIVADPTEEIVMRTHTSPMQARTMERLDPPVRVIVPGRTYRYEAQDASHEWMFTQLELSLIHISEPTR